MSDGARRCAQGVVGGLVGLAATSLANAFVAGWHPLAGRLAAAAVAGAMAWLAARPAGRRDAPAAAAVAVTALAALAFGHANPNRATEFGIDVYLRQCLVDRLAGPPSAALGVAGALAGGALAALLQPRRRLLVRALLVLLALNMAVAAAHVNPRLPDEAGRVRAPRQYVMDGFLWLRLHGLMEAGQGYYPAFYAAYTQRFGERGVPGNPFNWRPPTLFYLWMAIPGGGSGLLVAFWIGAALAMAAAFALARRYVDEGVALWGPALLGTLYLYGGCSIWFPFQEYWASFFLLTGWWAWAEKRWPAAAMLLAVAALIREQDMAMVAPILVVMGACTRGRERAAAWGAVAVAALGYAAHYAVVLHYVVPGTHGLSSWRSAGPTFLRRCLEFGSVFLADRRPLLAVFLLLGIAGAGTLPWRLSTAEGRLGLVIRGTSWIWLAGLLVFGQAERWYWGLVALPQLLACVPLAARLLAPRQDIEANSTKLPAT